MVSKGYVAIYATIPDMLPIPKKEIIYPAIFYSKGFSVGPNKFFKTSYDVKDIARYGANPNNEKVYP